MKRAAIATILLAFSVPQSAIAQTKPPLPLPAPVRFEEACLQSGGAAGAITPSTSTGVMTYNLLEADRPILFTFNLAEGTRAVTLKWTDGKGNPRQAIVGGATTLTVVARSFAMEASEYGPAAWCTRVHALPPADQG